MINVNYSKSGKSVTVDERALAVALCVPSQDMVFLTVGSDELGGFWQRVDPVVAIRSQIVDRYSCTGEHWNGGPLLHEELLDCNWHFDGREVQDHPLILDGDYGLISTEDDLLKDSTSVHVLIVIPKESDRVLTIQMHVHDLQVLMKEKLEKLEEKEKQEKEAQSLK